MASVEVQQRNAEFKACMLTLINSAELGKILEKFPELKGVMSRHGVDTYAGQMGIDDTSLERLLGTYDHMHKGLGRKSEEAMAFALDQTLSQIKENFNRNISQGYKNIELEESINAAMDAGIGGKEILGMLRSGTTKRLKGFGINVEASVLHFTSRAILPEQDFFRGLSAKKRQEFIAGERDLETAKAIDALEHPDPVQGKLMLANIDPDAVLYAKVIRQHAEIVYNLTRAEGVTLERFDMYTIPQTHNIDRVIDIGKDTWVKVMMENMDHEQGILKGIEDFATKKKVMESAYDRHIERNEAMVPDARVTGPKKRRYIFKSEYNATAVRQYFGQQTTYYDGMTVMRNKAAKRYATVRTFGPVFPQGKIMSRAAAKKTRTGDPGSSGPEGFNSHPDGVSHALHTIWERLKREGKPEKAEGVRILGTKILKDHSGFSEQDSVTWHTRIYQPFAGLVSSTYLQGAVYNVFADPVYGAINAQMKTSGMTLTKIPPVVARGLYEMVSVMLTTMGRAAVGGADKLTNRVGRRITPRMQTVELFTNFRQLDNYQPWVNKEVAAASDEHVMKNINAAAVDNTAKTYQKIEQGVNKFANLANRGTLIDLATRIARERAGVDFLEFFYRKVVLQGKVPEGRLKHLFDVNGIDDAAIEYYRSFLKGAKNWEDMGPLINQELKRVETLLGDNHTNIEAGHDYNRLIALKTATTRYIDTSSPITSLATKDKLGLFGAVNTSGEFFRRLAVMFYGFGVETTTRAFPEFISSGMRGYGADGNYSLAANLKRNPTDFFNTAASSAAALTISALPLIAYKRYIRGHDIVTEDFESDIVLEAFLLTAGPIYANIVVDILNGTYTNITRNPLLDAAGPGLTYTGNLVASLSSMSQAIWKANMGDFKSALYLSRLPYLMPGAGSFNLFLAPFMKSYNYNVRRMLDYGEQGE